MSVEGRVTYARQAREVAVSHADAANRQAEALERIAAALEVLVAMHEVAPQEQEDDGESA